MVEGGVATNVTPDECSFTFELRSIDETAARADIDALLSEITEELNPEMKTQHPEAGITFERIFA